MSERDITQRDVDWNGLIEAALEMPGSLGNTYRRLYQYSMSNCAFLYMQGVEPQPVATFNRWKELGRHVKRGAKAREIIRPITVTLKDQVDEQGQPKKLTKFKPVRCIFPISDTEGDPLPEIELPEWSKDRALGALSIREVAFTTFEVNVQGYSEGRDFAVNPAAVYPVKTMFHELSHIVLGHTVADTMEEYQQHRGVYEFQAEGSGHLVLNELGLMTEDMASVSRAYIQHWMSGARPEPKAIRQVFTSADTILKAGHEAPVEREQETRRAS